MCMISASQAGAAVRAHLEQVFNLAIPDASADAKTRAHIECAVRAEVVRRQHGRAIGIEAEVGFGPVVASLDLTTNGRRGVAVSRRERQAATELVASVPKHVAEAGARLLGGLSVLSGHDAREREQGSRRDEGLRKGVLQVCTL